MPDRDDKPAGWFGANGTIAGWRRRVATLKREVTALAFAARDRRTPWLARILIVAVVGYALSPIDLIPDFIPVLGLLDDLVIVPAGLWLALRLIPPEVMAQARQRAGDARLPKSRAAAVVIVSIWLASALAIGIWSWRQFA